MSLEGQKTLKEEVLMRDISKVVQQHSLIREGANPDFFEGMLLGNGDIGLCVTVRPDGIVLHLGKNDVWDIRVSEEHMKHLLPFKEVIRLIRRASERMKARGLDKKSRFFTLRDKEYEDYIQKVRSSYAKPWPHPWPCGRVIVRWDPRKVAVKEQKLDIYTGLLRVSLEVEGHDCKLYCFVHRDDNQIWLWGEGNHLNQSLTSVCYRPFLSPETYMPEPEMWKEVETHPSETYTLFGIKQRLPATPPELSKDKKSAEKSPHDREFALAIAVPGALSQKEKLPGLEFTLNSQKKLPFKLCITLFSSLEASDTKQEVVQKIKSTYSKNPEKLHEKSKDSWRKFWSRSFIELDDKELETVWYRNQYWLACCLKPGKVAPGLFGNWFSIGKIGTAWHGDYHLDYNEQQIYWGVFSSNHVEQHEPYVDLCWNLFEMAKKFCKEHFNLPGAYYPISAYPVPSKVVPYPVPPWGYCICITAWTLQSLWWHYLYTQDIHFLKNKAYPLLREGARFYAAYLTKESDGYYHVFPTVSPEMYGFTVDFRYNKDCIMDLALIKFLMKAAVKASELLDCDAEERKKWIDIQEHLAPYPTGEDAEGKIWIDVANGPVNPVYNIPVTLAPVFPGEEIGLHSSSEELELARRTAKLIRTEGGNDLVYLPLILSRLGILDFQVFKREIRYCQIPNGTCTDRVRQVGGRYSDDTDFDFMSRMGIWVENFALPAVINECLMQSYTGIIRLFPNVKGLRHALFNDLRAVGAFLVSAEWRDGEILSPVIIKSLAGSRCRIVRPWNKELRIKDMRTSEYISFEIKDEIIIFDTQAGGEYALEGIS